MQLKINGRDTEVDVPADTPLLWVLRDNLNMTGTKFGCGAGVCGACSVQIDGVLNRSCQVAIGDVSNTEITTIEGISGKIPAALQKAWLELQVPQCGYCQSGMLMAAAALLNENAQPTDDDIDAAMTNICRCGTYPRVRAAIHRVASES